MATSVSDGRVAIKLFETLMDAIGDDAEARTGLAEAYEAMSVAERGRLLETIVADVGNRDWVAPLLTLLSVEEDPARAEAILAALPAAAPARASGGEAAWLHGHDDDGGVVIVRPRFGAVVAVVAVWWRDGALWARTVELTERADLDGRLRELEVPVARRAISPERAVEHLSEIAWRTVRAGGALPEGLRRHADLFDVRGWGATQGAGRRGHGPDPGNAA